MPELPEVETLRRQLEATLVDRRIVTAELLTPKILAGVEGRSVRDLVGATIEAARRRAKYLILDLSNGLSLVVHLGLAGQIVVEPPAGERVAGGHPVPAYDRPLPHKQTHLVLQLDDGAVVFLTDIRKFAHVWIAPTPDVFSVIPDERLGPEIQGPAFTREELARRLRARKGARLKPLLLDQSFLAGLGNIYVDESLWGAGLHPLRAAGSLDEAEIDRLHREIAYVIDLALSDGVAKIVNAKAVPGAALPRVHGRANLPCPRCGTTIEKSRVGGRGTYVCPACQLAPAARPFDAEQGGRT
jgi:formamidopyrimidine-DNA glycosylase